MAERIDFADAGIMRSVFLALVTTFILPVAVADDLSGTLAGRVVNFEGTKGVEKGEGRAHLPGRPVLLSRSNHRQGGFLHHPG